VLINDLIDIFTVKVGVPDLLRVDHNHRAEFASIKATGGIDPDPALPRQAQLLDSRLGIIAYLGGIALLATLFALFAFVDAEKNMILVIRHRQLL
jgi:hypothetical protein